LFHRFHRALNIGFNYYFWGRTGDNYCRTRFIEDRYQWINTRTNSNKPTLEYRLPKFQNAEQFYNVLKFVTSATTIIKRGFNEASTKGIDDVEMAVDISRGILHTY
jgi:hypothetical protein